MSYINVTKNAIGQNYKYADLQRVAAVLTDEGFDFRQHTRWDNDAGNWVVETRIKFPGKDEKMSEWDSPVPIITGARMSRQGKRILSDMQEYQSAMTSARRYSLMIAANVVPDDDDASSAGYVGQQQQPQQSGLQPGQRQGCISPAQWKQIQQAATNANVDVFTAVQESIGRNPANAAEITLGEFASIMAYLQGGK